jgi:hypothetical protein
MAYKSKKFKNLMLFNQNSKIATLLFLREHDKKIIESQKAQLENYKNQIANMSHIQKRLNDKICDITIAYKKLNE